uniref:Phorbol-ester/DAG-type domain-containing protein n=1 Tax=Octopus bimaculoides TaxID=37653 RepID=A0A0L8HEY8_OCTBM
MCNIHKMRITTAVTLALLLVVIHPIKLSLAAQTPCKPCKINDELILQKAWVCGECGSLYKDTAIEYCCVCDQGFYDKCLIATGIDKDRDTNLNPH